MLDFDFLTIESFIAQRAELEPFFHRLTNHTDGEITPQDLIDRAASGAMLIGVMRESGSAVFVIGCTVSTYPSKKVLHIALAAGVNTQTFVRSFFQAIHIAARAHDCSDIEARCRPSMARLVRRYGRGMALREFSTFRLSV